MISCSQLTFQPHNMAANGNHAWGAPNAQRGPETMKSIDENTKLFQKLLEDRMPKSQKMNKKNAYPNVQGGVPPHLLKTREYVREHTRELAGSGAQQSTVSSLIMPHLVVCELASRS